MKLTFKEWLAIIIVLLAGIGYITLDLVSIYSSIHGGEKVGIGAIKIKQLSVAMHIKLIATGLLCIIGAILYLKQKTTGWIITAAMLLIITFLTAMVFIVAATTNYWDASTMMVTAIMLIAIFCFVALFKKQVRQKFNINNKSYLYALLLYGALIAAFSF